MLLVGRVPKIYICFVINVPYSGRYSSEFNGFWCLWFSSYLSFLSHIQAITENITVHLWNKRVIRNILEVQKTSFSVLPLQMEKKKTNYQRDFTIFLCYLLFSIQYSFCCAKICYCWFKQFFTYPMESGMVICWTFVCCKISNHIHSTSKFSVWMFFNGGLSLFSPSFKKMFFFCF